MQVLSSNIMMVRPKHFGFNKQTAITNTFQNEPPQVSSDIIRLKAIDEFDKAVQKLRAEHLNVTVIEDTDDQIRPDAVFPNNWISFHEDGTIYLYPMCTPNRRLEKRSDIIETLRNDFYIKDVIDLPYTDTNPKFLEGTGSMVFDHINKKAYACISPRTDKDLFINFCDKLKYEAIYFTALDKHKEPIYHTNVLMGMGTNFAIICLDAIADEKEKDRVINILTATQKTIISITHKQMERFLGNVIELTNFQYEKLLVLSQSAFDALSQEQRATLKNYVRLVPIPIPTIETIGGGSIRCMISEILLPRHSRIL